MPIPNNVPTLVGPNCIRSGDAKPPRQITPVSKPVGELVEEALKNKANLKVGLR